MIITTVMIRDRANYQLIAINDKQGSISDDDKS